MTNNIDFDRFIIHSIELVRVSYEVYKVVLFYRENLRLQIYNNRKLQRKQPKLIFTRNLVLSTFDKIYFVYLA